MRYIKIAARWVFILCLPLILLSGSIGWVANSLWLYEYGFEKYDISQAAGLDEPELEKAARGLISYWNSGDELIDVTVEKEGRAFALFNERELIHLKDVKGLFRLDYLVLLVTLAYALGYSIIKLFRTEKLNREFVRGILAGSVLTLVVMLALGLGMAFGFERLFWQFHLISFANDFWMLDPSRDYLIMLFPSGFWFDATLFMALGATGMAVILGGIAGVYLWLSKNKSIP